MALPVCVIVGYGPGIGHGLARAFGRARFALGLLARTPDKLAGPLAELHSAGYPTAVAAADAAEETSLLAGLRSVRDQLGEAEVLIYNAVAFRAAPPTALSAGQLTADFQTNVAGALTAANLVLPAMKARGRGAVLFTGGGWALYPSAAVASTAIGKAAQRHLALTLAEELRVRGVRAGTILIMGQVAPGTAFDPDTIGEAFLAAVRTPPDLFQPEIQFRGA